MTERLSSYAAAGMTKSVGEFVAEDYRTAAVFEKYGIDFCCGGQAELSAVCLEQGLDLAAFQGELDAVKSEPIKRGENYGEWELPLLADYIVQTHHTYLHAEMGVIAGYARKISEVHGARHPEAVAITRIFEKVTTEMEDHLREEEEVLFPAIKKADAARKAGAIPTPQDLETIRIAIEGLGQDHEGLGEAVHTIRRFTSGYAPPKDVCNTYMVTLEKLREFEEDLHKHVHLENNILFPRALQL